MKKTTKLIVMLTVISLIACMLAFAIADDKIYTSPTFKIPIDQVAFPEEPEEEPEQPTEPEAETEGEPEDLIEVEPEELTEDEPEDEAEGEPEAEAEDEPEAEGEQEAEKEKGQKKEEEPKPVERQVRIFTSRKDIVTAGEMIVLTSELIGFDNVVVNYQWQVDRGDGAGWVNVDGATRGKHTFIANKETIMYSWRLIVTTDD